MSIVKTLVRGGKTLYRLNFWITAISDMLYFPAKVLGGLRLNCEKAENLQSQHAIFIALF